MIKKMKYLKIYIVSLTFLGLFGCGDDFHYLEPVDRYVYSNFAKNQAQVEQAVVACYQQSAPIVSNYLWFFGDYLSDNTSYYYNVSDRGASEREFVDEFLAEARSGQYSGMYLPSFTGVARANYVLESIEPITFTTEELKSRRTAEARFFRAWHYFNLVRVYGDVPILTRVVTDSRESYSLTREPVDKIYQDIIVPDATFAVDKLPAQATGKDAGRITKGAAIMLLAKALMTQKKFAEAKPFLEEIKKLGYSLNPIYIDNFNPSKKNGVESIYELQSGVIGYNIGLMGTFAPHGSLKAVWGGGAGSTGGANQPTNDLIAAYETLDTARKNTVVGIWKKSATENIPYMAKFNYWDAALSGNASNFPIYRYADALLMLAECQNEVGELDNALVNLNLVRTRAKIPSKTRGNANPAYAVNNQAEMRLAVEKERQVELAGEGHRWFDLVRTGRAEQVMKEHGAREKAIPLKATYILPAAYTNIRTLMPFPDREIREFGFPQTPGW
jgi:starch-binding outer membrane protein, SusD/RagB family